MGLELYVSLGIIAISAFAFYHYFKRRGETIYEEQEITDEDYLELEQLIQEDVEEWQVIKDTEILKLYKKNTGNSPFAIIKAQVLIPAEADRVFEAIWDERVRQSWDDVIRGFKVIEVLDERTDEIYFYADSPIRAIISNREFVQRRRNFMIGNSRYIIYRSIEKEEIPIPDGWVRGHTIISGYVITPVEDGEIRLDFISQNDLKGSIPPEIINTFAPQKALDWVKKLSKTCSS